MKKLFLLVALCCAFLANQANADSECVKECDKLYERDLEILLYSVCKDNCQKNPDRYNIKK